MNVMNGQLEVTIRRWISRFIREFDDGTAELEERTQRVCFFTVCFGSFDSGIAFSRLAFLFSFVPQLKDHVSPLPWLVI